MHFCKMLFLLLLILKPVSSIRAQHYLIPIVFVSRHLIYHLQNVYFYYFSKYVSKCHSQCSVTVRYIVDISCIYIIVSTGGIRGILWFSICYTAAAPRREIFDINALRGKLHQLGSPNLQDIFIGGELHWD